MRRLLPALPLLLLPVLLLGPVPASAQEASPTPTPSAVAPATATPGPTAGPTAAPTSGPSEAPAERPTDPASPDPASSPAAGPTASPSATPSPAPEPLLTGTIDGTDGRAVNALLGFDWMNAEGKRLRRDGCVQSPECPVVGYASVVRVNPTLTAVGTADTSTATTSWSVQPPPGARRLFLEVYPQNERFRTDEARYGHSMRHSVPLPYDGPMPLRLPLVTCDEGADVGTVRGSGLRDGEPLPLARVVAWSLEPFDAFVRPVLGWNIGTADEFGTFVVPNLVAGQRYQVWVTAKDGTVRKTFGVVPPRCGETLLSVDFTLPVPPSAAPAPPPPPSPVLPVPVITAGAAALVEGGAEPGQVVELLAATRPSAELRPVRTTTASPSGYYAFTVFPPATTELRVRVAGQQSPPVLQQVRSRVTASFTRPAAKTAPRTYRVTGGVRPAAVQPVDLYLRTADGGRRLLGSGRTGADGRYVLTRRFLVPGTYDLFVATRAGAVSAAGSSPVVRTRVS